jgi:hypothetical protein
MSRTAFWGFALCLTFCFRIARAELLVNGGFSSFATSGTGITGGNSGQPPYGPYWTYVGGTSGLTGWTILGQSIDVNSSGYFQPPPGSTTCVDLVGTSFNGTPQLGGVGQTITGLSAGQLYKLDFWHSANPDATPFYDDYKPKIMDVVILDGSASPVTLGYSGSGVRLGNNHVEYTVTTGTRTVSEMQWIEDYVTFVAPTSNVTVQFWAVANTNPSLTTVLAGPTLGSISLTPIPEPASLTFLGLGAAAIFTRRHARKR